ncbi:KAP family NTPase [Prevotella communis]|uniref:KAP family P-loop NTPase fold protein n=1 Tax=Prevotella communis TaxID=2913614 RepID=UPI001EDB764B|nr:P-loop NTPase fold protein [Prevotella communis]UKK59619.1 KAP family NTPase [Prevotella communis]
MKRGISYLIKKGRTFAVKHPWYIPHFNGKRLSDRTTLKTIGWYAFGFLWLLTAIEMGKTYVCNNIIIRDEIDTYFVTVENILADKDFLNVMITLTGVLASTIWLKHVWEDRYLSLKRMMIAVCVMPVLTFAGTFSNIHSAIKIDYAAFCWYVMFVQLLLDFFKLWYRRWNVKAPGKSKLNYITELPKENLDEKVRLDYAKDVLEWLFNTDISESSFAVGITSEWGSGKTSFLLDMKKAMKGKCYQIDFKPWHCQTPDQIVNEFFELFRKTIKEIYSPLQKPIVRYAQLLSDAGLPSYVKPLFGLIPGMGHSIDSYKSKIECGLKQLDKPVVVTIDDMDRLAADELFEVLRLIRNTAAFPNLIYIACYDKAYVVRQISNMGIGDSDLYLEKIFPLELSLPKTEEEALIETFRRAMMDMYFLQGRHDSLRSRITAEDELIMVRMLPTYRKIKRFARVLMTNTMFIMKKLGEKKVDLYDIFLIELIHFSMQDVYMVLRDTPEEFLEVTIDERTRQAKYYLPSDKYIEDTLNELIGRTLEKYELQLIKKCFAPRKGEKIHYLPYVDSYLNYFCLATPTAQITKEEFAEAVDDRSEIMGYVHRWFYKLPIKKSSSLYSRMMETRIKSLSLEQWKNHMFLLYSWLCEDDYDMIKNVMVYYLLKDNVRPKDEEASGMALQYATERLEKIISIQKENRMNVAKNLCGYYSLIEKSESEYLLGCDAIKKMLILNFNLYLEEKHVHQDAINVVALNGNDLNAFVKANDVADSGYDTFGDFSHSHKNLIIDEVIKYFESYTEKSSHWKDAKTMYDNGPNKYRSTTFVDQTAMKEEKYSIFGDDAHFEEFLNKCFVGEKLEKV